MSERARALREAETIDAERALNAHSVIAAAERLTAVDMSTIPLERLTQVVIGWMRAAFEQSRVIATLVQSDLGHASAPNRRAFVELLLRLKWLHSMSQADRAGAVDALIEEDRKHATKAFAHLNSMGFESAVDLSDMESLVLDVPEKGSLREQARNFIEAAKATGDGAGLYYAWREETQYAHASSVAAVAHAPRRHGAIGTGHPPVVDPDLKTHQLGTLLLVSLTYQLLIDEGAPEADAVLVITAFLGGS